jgi:hypothetical protein
MQSTTSVATGSICCCITLNDTCRQVPPCNCLAARLLQAHPLGKRECLKSGRTLADRVTASLVPQVRASQSSGCGYGSNWLRQEPQTRPRTRRSRGLSSDCSCFRQSSESAAATPQVCPDTSVVVPHLPSRSSAFCSNAMQRNACAGFVKVDVQIAADSNEPRIGEKCNFRS